MSDSILETVKELLLVSKDDPTFDLSIITSINSAIFSLRQLGIGPNDGFEVSGVNETWADLLGPYVSLYQGAKTYIGFKARMAFDPPGTSYHITAMERQIQELEFRLQVARDDLLLTIPPVVDPTDPTDPTDPGDGVDDGIIDGLSLELHYQNAKV